MRTLSLTLLLAAALPCILAGCASSAIGPVRDGSYTLLPGQHVELANKTVLTYESYSDSRCPPNMRCIWAGELVYHFSLTSPKPTEAFTLGPAKTVHVSSALNSASIALDTASVPPTPLADAAPASYTVKLNVSSSK